MTKPVSLTLESVSYQLPDGSILFSGLNASFDRRATAIVGRNGIGKSVLARILAGELLPGSGKCTRSGTVYYLPQQISQRHGQTVAALAGVKPIFDALARIESGGTLAADFETVGERWDIRQQLQQQLTGHGLGHLRADTPAAQLSGGESMRVGLLGALLSQADFLILDEPTNHLDRDNRRILHEQLRQWQNGLIIVSHDRALLENMQRIVELSTLGLHSYGGGYSFYAQAKAAQQASATAELAQRKAERRREQRLLQEQCEKMQRRQARGNQQAREANQAKILLGGQKQRSEISSGKLKVKQDARHHELSTQVREAAQRIEQDAPIVLYTPDAEPNLPKKIAEFDNAMLPFVGTATANIDLALNNLSTQQGLRIGLIGANGSGKSTLLRMLTGTIAPQAGRCEVFVKTVYLDQHLSALDSQQSILEHLLQANSTLGEAALRTRLAQLGLNAQRILLPSYSLSGGERIKGALACALYANQPAQLLLLDEPSNHLDLIAVQALEEMLRQYRGALIVVSHDENFLNNLSLTHRLSATRDGWLLQEVAP